MTARVSMCVGVHFLDPRSHHKTQYRLHIVWQLSTKTSWYFSWDQIINRNVIVNHLMVVLQQSQLKVSYSLHVWESQTAWTSIPRLSTMYVALLWCAALAKLSDYSFVSRLFTFDASSGIWFIFSLLTNNNYITQWHIEYNRKVLRWGKQKCFYTYDVI